MGRALQTHDNLLKQGLWKTWRLACARREQFWGTQHYDAKPLLTRHLNAKVAPGALAVTGVSMMAVAPVALMWSNLSSTPSSLPFPSPACGACKSDELPLRSLLLSCQCP